MKSNRRNFLKTATAAGAGAFAGSFLAGCAPKSPESQLSAILDSARKNYVQKFNMSGYAAPPVPTVRVGFIGLGDRGSGAVQRLSYIEGVEIKALRYAACGCRRFTETFRGSAGLRHGIYQRREHLAETGLELPGS